MKKESNTYKIVGKANINTTITSQQDVLADLRSIKGVTIVTFTPENEGMASQVFDNQNYKGTLELKVDNFPFENFDKKTHLKLIINTIRKIPAIKYFRPNLITLLEHETL